MESCSITSGASFAKESRSDSSSNLNNPEKPTCGRRNSLAALWGSDKGVVPRSSRTSAVSLPGFILVFSNISIYPATFFRLARTCSSFSWPISPNVAPISLNLSAALSCLRRRQTMLRSGRKHAIGLIYSFGDQIINEDAYVSLVPPKHHRILFRDIAGGVDARY